MCLCMCFVKTLQKCTSMHSCCRHYQCNMWLLTTDRAVSGFHVQRIENVRKKKKENHVSLMSHYVEQKKKCRKQDYKLRQIYFKLAIRCKPFLSARFFQIKHQTFISIIFTDEYKRGQIRYAWHLPLYLYFPTASEAGAKYLEPQTHSNISK